MQLKTPPQYFKENNWVNKQMIQAQQKKKQKKAV